MSRFKIAYSSESLEEIKRIINWYNDIIPGLGNRFRKNLLSEIAVIKQNPFARSVRYDSVRFAVVKKFHMPHTTQLTKTARLLKYKLSLVSPRMPKIIGE